MATVRPQEAICRIVKERILELEPEAGIEPVNYKGVVVIEDKLLVIEDVARKLQLYNRHDGTLISTSHRMENNPMHVCLLSKTEVALCLVHGTILIMSFESIGDIKLVKRFRTGFLNRCYSLSRLNSEKLVVSGKKDNIMLCWDILSITDRHLDSTHVICEGNVIHSAIKDNTVYMSCWTDDSHTNGVYAYDVLNPHTNKFLYQHRKLETPGSIMVHRDCVFVSDLHSNRIHQLTDSGQPVTIHEVSSDLFGLCYDDQHGELYTTSLWSKVITVYKMEFFHQPAR